MSKLPSKLVVLGLMLSLLAACASATPAPAPTVASTATPLPPTATAVPTTTPVPPTNTPQPTATRRLTDTPAPTATPQPTDTATPVPTKVVTPKPTNTKAPVAVSGGVSSQPSTVQKSVKQAFDAVHAMISLLDQMQTGGAELCAPLLAKYQSVSNAPRYDVSGETALVQQSYDLYRSAIDTLNARATTFIDCGKGGGPIGGLDWGETRRITDKALGLLGQAAQRFENTSSVAAMSPMAAALARLRASLEGVASVLDKHLGKTWPTPLRGIEPDCAELRAHHAAIRLEEIDVTGQPQAVVNAYQTYRRAFDDYNLKAGGVASMCANPDYELNTRPMTYIRADLKAIIESLRNAQNSLGQ